jgi:hypothetical protein
MQSSTIQESIMLKEEDGGSRTMMFPHTINRFKDEIMMVARNWFDFFAVADLVASMDALNAGHEIKLVPRPVTQAPQTPQEVYICRVKDGYLVMDSTKSPRTIQVLFSKILEMIQ